MIWISRIRLRVLAFLLGVVLTVIGVLSLTALPALPVMGVAFAAAAMAVNSMTARLREPICHGCGGVLRGAPVGQYGATCPKCGSLSQPGRVEVARADDIEDDEADGVA